MRDHSELRRTATSAGAKHSSSFWQHLGLGYLNPGDVLLAADVEASLSVAREAMLDLRRAPPKAGRL